MALIYNASFDSQTRVLSLLDKAGNVISSCEVPSKGNVDDPNKPLMFRSLKNASTVKLIENGTLWNTYQISKNGEDWTDYSFGNEIILNNEDVIYFRCSNHPTTQSYSNHVQFVMTGEIEAWHNAYSMISSDFSSAEGSVGDYGMYSLFEYCRSLTKAPLLLNALAQNCYFAMFNGCTALTQAPELPATTLERECYAFMFSGCTALTQAPELPATTLESFCYRGMFKDCTALAQAPLLPVTTLVNYCYGEMFYGCTSLQQAPSLPATTLPTSCYIYMFYGCTSLTKAPELPATTLGRYCYNEMFYGCASLKEVRIAATTTAQNALDNWLKNVSTTGDFYCDPNAKIFPTDSASGIPKGWTRHDINLINALTLTATADNSSVKLTKNGTLDNTFEVDTGNGWTAYEFDTVIPLNAGQSCKWRCSAHPTTQSGSNYVKFVMTGTIEASGNCNSMLLGGFENLTSLSGYDFAFYQLFSGCTALTQAPNLPATTLASKSYASMFYGCTSLTKAPNLPATKLAKYCYSTMFRGCTSLTKAPNLPVTTLADYCYEFMFFGCTALTQAPNLPATTLAKYCYDAMFYDCSSLTQAPNLPATNLAIACYGSMFHGCSSLTKAPNLPATTLAGSCYRNMFENCSALAEVRIAATTTASDALKNWLLNVASSGTVYAAPNFNDLPTNNASGIPQNWTRHALADYPSTP